MSSSDIRITGSPFGEPTRSATSSCVGFATASSFFFVPRHTRRSPPIGETVAVPSVFVGSWPLDSLRSLGAGGDDIDTIAIAAIQRTTEYTTAPRARCA